MPIKTPTPAPETPRPDEGPPYPGTPRWVKGFGIAVGALVLAFVVLMVAGDHGPGRHAAGGRLPDAGIGP